MAMMVLTKIAGQTHVCVCERDKHRHILRQKADSSESHDQSIAPHGRPCPFSDKLDLLIPFGFARWKNPIRTVK